MTRLIDRLHLLVENKYRRKVAPFSRDLGLEYRTVKSWFDRNTDPPSYHIDRIVEKTGVSRAWLETGEGEMYEPGKPGDQNPETNFEADETPLVTAPQRAAIMDRIKLAADMKRDGDLTEEEYATIKRLLLAEMAACV